jgi:hypothetical protein
LRAGVEPPAAARALGARRDAVGQSTVIDFALANTPTTPR